MKRIFFVLAVAALLSSAVFQTTGCLKEKVYEIVLFDETSTDIHHQETSVNNSQPVIVNYGDQIDKILKDAGWSRDKVKSAKVVAAYYGATANNNSHDWAVAGGFQVERIDDPAGPALIVNYTFDSVDMALGKKIQASLNDAGVDILNQALADFISGANPVLEFSVADGATITPTPSGADALDVETRAWIKIHVILEDESEFPDPF